MFRKETKGVDMLKFLIILPMFTLLVLGFQNCGGDWVPPEGAFTSTSVGGNADTDGNGGGDSDNNGGGNDDPVDPDPAPIRDIFLSIQAVSGSIEIGNSFSTNIYINSSDNYIADINVVAKLICIDGNQLLLHDGLVNDNQISVEGVCSVAGTAILNVEANFAGSQEIETSTTQISFHEIQEIPVDFNLVLSGGSNGVFKVGQEFEVVPEFVTSVNSNEIELNFAASHTSCEILSSSARKAKFKCNEVMSSQSISATIKNHERYVGSASTSFSVEKNQTTVFIEPDDLESIKIGRNYTVKYNTTPSLNKNQLNLSFKNGRCTGSLSDDTFAMSCDEEGEEEVSISVKSSNGSYVGSQTRSFTARKINYGVGVSPGDDTLYLDVNYPNSANPSIKEKTWEFSIIITGNGSESIQLSVSENSSNCEIVDGVSGKKFKLKCTKAGDVKLTVSASSVSGSGSTSKTFHVEKAPTWKYEYVNSRPSNLSTCSYPIEYGSCSKANLGEKMCYIDIYNSYLVPTCTQNY